MTEETLMARCLRLEAELEAAKKRIHAYQTAWDGKDLERQLFHIDFAMKRGTDFYSALQKSDEQLAASQLHIERLTEALELASIGACNCLTKSPDLKFHGENCRYRIFQEALSQTQSLDALNEERARVLEKAAEKVLDKWKNTQPVVVAHDLRNMAAAYRAKKEG